MVSTHEPVRHWLNYHHRLHFWMSTREGSIARACHALHLTQPTVSGQIRDSSAPSRPGSSSGPAGRSRSPTRAGWFIATPARSPHWDATSRMHCTTALAARYPRFSSIACLRRPRRSARRCGSRTSMALSIACWLTWRCTYWNSSSATIRRSHGPRRIRRQRAVEGVWRLRRHPSYCVHH